MDQTGRGDDGVRLVEVLDGARFAVARGGYDLGAVDAALEQLTAAARAGEDPAAVAARCAALRFPGRWVRLGYDRGDVDAFVATVVRLAGDRSP